MECQYCGSIIGLEDTSRQQKEDGDGEAFVAVTGSCSLCGFHTQVEHTNISLGEVFDELPDDYQELLLDYDYTETQEQLRRGTI